MMRITWRSHWNLLNTACDNLIRFRPRTIVVLLCLVAVIFPFLTALSISEGIKFQSNISVEEGADFFVTGDAAGTSTSLSLDELRYFSSIDHVKRAVPRIVGRTYVKSDIITIVGLPADQISPPVGLDQGRTIEKKGDLWVGTAIAEKYHLSVGDEIRIPLKPRQPFYIAGIFKSACSIWSSSVIFMGIEDAQDLFDMKHQATDFLIFVDPERAFVVDMALQQQEKMRRFSPMANIRVQSKPLVRRYLNRGFNTRMGIFTALYCTAFALAIPALLITSGFGQAERRKEIGMLKVLGWQSMEVMEMVMWENLILSISGACFSFLLSLVWVRLFNGFFIAQFFIAESGFRPDFILPSRFCPLPLFFSIFFSMLLTMTGSLYNTWRYATVDPAEVIR